MIGSISSTSASASVQQYPAVQFSPSPKKQGTPSSEDTVQLSEETQKHLTETKQVAKPATTPSFSQIIKEAANGDITALARLALVG